MTVPQIEAAPAARAPNRQILLATRDALRTEGCAVETAQEASKAAAHLSNLVAKVGAVINGRPNYQVLFDILYER